MLDQLLNLVKENAGDTIINNPSIPNQHNDEAISLASSSIFDALKGQVSNGGIGNLIGMFSGGGTSIDSNQLVSGLVSNLSGQYAQKFGISPETANNVASSLITTVIGKFINKTNDPSDSSFDLNNILGSLTGKGSSDIAGMIGQFTGNGQSQTSGANNLGGIIGKLFG
ncbi:MAG: hypothetical protein EAZ07_03055 [Cytophagales bacterium]|nr:MAG: hypothetical protein EAZ07_03055 [Cytophagales bacterium]